MILRQQNGSTTKDRTVFARLVFKSRGSDPVVIDITRTTNLIGSSKGCKVRLKSSSVASVHAVLLGSLDGLEIRSFDGRTELKVNGRSVSESLLLDGDIIQIGRFELQVETDLAGESGESEMADVEKRRLNRLRSVRGHLQFGQRRPSRNTKDDDRQLETVDNKQLEELQQQLAFLQQENNRFAEEQEEVNAVRAQLAEQEALVEAEQQRLAKEHQDLDARMSAWVEEQRTTREDLTQAKDALEKAESALAAERDDFRQREAGLSELQETVKSERSAFEVERDELEQDLVDKENSLAAEKQRLEQLDRDLQQQKVQLDERQQQVGAGEEEIEKRMTSQVQADRLELQEERSRIEAEKSSLDEFRIRRQRDLADQNARLEKLQAELEQQRSDLEREKAETIDKSQQQDLLIVDIHKQQSELEESQAALKAQRAQLVQQQTEVEQQRVELQQQDSILQNELAQTREGTARLTSEERKLAEKSAEQAEEIRSLSDQLKAGQQTIDETRSELDLQTIELTKNRDELQQERASLESVKAQLAGSEVELKEATRALEQQRASLDVDSRELGGLKSKFEADVLALDSRQASIDQHATELDAQGREVQREKSELQQLREKLDQDINQLQAEQQKLKTEAAKCRSEFETIDQARANLVQASATLRDHASQIEQWSQGLSDSDQVVAMKLSGHVDGSEIEALQATFRSATTDLKQQLLHDKQQLSEQFEGLQRQQHELQTSQSSLASQIHAFDEVRIALSQQNTDSQKSSEKSDELEKLRSELETSREETRQREVRLAETNQQLLDGHAELQQRLSDWESAERISQQGNGQAAANDSGLSDEVASLRSELNQLRARLVTSGDGHRSWEEPTVDEVRPRKKTQRTKAAAKSESHPVGDNSFLDATVVSGGVNVADVEFEDQSLNARRQTRRDSLTPVATKPEQVGPRISRHCCPKCGKRSMAKSDFRFIETPLFLLMHRPYRCIKCFCRCYRLISIFGNE